MAKLEIHKAKERSRDFFLPDADVLTVGRTQSSDIVLADDSQRISRYHAALVRLTAGPCGYFVRDLGSLLGTRVNGQPVYQRVLNDGDVIDIADYQLVYSAISERRTRVHRIKAVSRKTDDLSLDRSTHAMKLDGLSGIVSLTEEQGELLEHFHQKSRQGLNFTNSADDLMHAVVHAVRADRGFIGLFPTDDAEIVSELGLTNLGEQDEVEVSDTAFNTHLLEGTIVQDDRTILVPIAEGKRTAGFVCVDRLSPKEPFRKEDASFLQGVAKLLSLWIRTESEKAPGLAGPATVTEWPMQMVGSQENLAQIRKQIGIAASTDMNVLVLGESGSGKELVAKAVHDQCANCYGPFIARNCSQTTETLAEAEIFGYSAKSGISGADPKGAPGWFEIAHGGTLFLDEVHRLNPAMQDKFLRVLQDKVVWRIGAESGTPVTVKVIAATDEDLEKGVEDGWIRKPFYYRFGTKIQVQPLRERKGDIPLLVYFFLDKYAKSLGSRVRMLSHRALRMFLDYNWPGNIRQLENIIRNAVANNQEIIFSWDLPDELAPKALECIASKPVSVRESAQVRLGEASRPPKSMQELEKEKIKEALEATFGNVTRAAQILGYKSRQTILNKMDKYGIPRNYADVKSEQP